MEIQAQSITQRRFIHLSTLHNIISFLILILHINIPPFIISPSLLSPSIPHSFDSLASLRYSSAADSPNSASADDDS